MTLGAGGIFGNPNAYGGGGLFGKKKPWEVDPIQHGPMGYSQPAPQPEQPKGFLDGGKLGLKDGLALALGSIGGAFSGRNNFGQFLAGTMMQNRRMEQQQKMAEQQRVTGLEDYEAKKQIDQRYAKQETPDPYRWRSNSGDLMELGPDGNPRIAYDDPDQKIQWIVGADGVPRPYSVGQSNRPAIGSVMADPRKTGGSGGNAGGGF